MKLDEARGDWALVTGASGAIGGEFARQLARAGMHIVLVGRRDDVMAQLAALLRDQYGVKTFVVAIDLAEKGSAAQLRQQLQGEGIRIRLLCNNAGIGRLGKFESSPAEAVQEIIDLNTAALVGACHQFYADLASFPSSAVINVSSQAAYHPIPYMNVYAASKAFVQSFSQALHCEWQDKGIVVQALVPGPTESGFDRLAGDYDIAVARRVAPTVAVTASLKALAGRQAVVIAATGTVSQRFFATVLPRAMFLKEVAKRFQPPR